MQVQKSSIVVGNRFVGHIWVDGGSVRGEGGPARPQLVVPLIISMDNTPVEAMVALLWLRGSLSTKENPTPADGVSTRVSEMLIDNLPIRSLPRGGMDHTILLRFPLASDEIERVEGARHAVGGDSFTLYLTVEAVVAAVASTFNEVRAGVPPTVTPWDFNLGMFSDFKPFWSPKVDLVRFTVEQSTWVREVLPGLGYERRRLIELSFPPALPDHASAAREWDKARKAYDTQRYGDCVAECRDLLAMWGRQLAASTKQPVAHLIAKREGWAESDQRIAFIDQLWKTATDLTNVEHHPEGIDDTQTFDRQEARLMLVLTAALSEYVATRLV